MRRALHSRLREALRRSLVLTYRVYALRLLPSTTPLGTPVESPLRAGDEVRTRDIQLGRLTLYQLSYSREVVGAMRPGLDEPVRSRSLNLAIGGGCWIRTNVGVSRQVYSLLPLATRATLRIIRLPPHWIRAGEGNRTPNLRFTKPVLCQLSYTSIAQNKVHRARSSGEDDRGFMRPILWGVKLHGERRRRGGRRGETPGTHNPGGAESHPFGDLFED